MSAFSRKKELTPLFCFSQTKGAIIKKRIHTEEKAKVVAADWGIELIEFLAALAILYQDDLKNRMISS